MNGKVAFITGGASGIGFSLARACGAEGMQVMIADLDQKALDTAVTKLTKEQIDVAGVICDVTSLNSLRAAANATLQCYGKVHMLVNNAGVLVVGCAGENSIETWHRAMDVNVMGVVYGVEIFLPLIREHGEGGHILNTASVAGHVGYAGVLAYATTKHAVVGYTEALADELKSENIGVSALCPGFTKTQIANNNGASCKPEGDPVKRAQLSDAVDSGMSPDVVATFALEQIRKDTLYIFSHPRSRKEISDRWRAISEAFEETDASDLINSDPDSKRVAEKNVSNSDFGFQN